MTDCNNIIVRISSAVLLFSSVLLLCGKPSYAVTGWTYATTASNCGANTTSPCGPEYWDKVSATCNTVTYPIQSPINLAYNDVVKSDTIAFPVLSALGGGCKNWTQFTNQYVFEISFQESDCFNLTATYNGQQYWLNQIHVHSGSEHTVGGGQFDAEIHLVHLNTKLGAAYATSAFVLGIFLEETSTSVPLTNNTFFQRFFGRDGYYATVVEEEQVVINQAVPVDPYSTLLPSRPGVYSYVGSLTTPPCTSGVQWFVFDETVKISPTDLHVLRKSVADHPNNLLSQVGNNNRGYTIPLGSRTLYYSSQSMSVLTYSPTAAPTFTPTAATASKTNAALALGATGTALSIILMLAFGIYVCLYSSRSEPLSKATDVQMTRTANKV